MAQTQPGIIVTQAGVSAPYAADYQMVFNSNWPSLQVAFDTTITVASLGSKTVAHGLGFNPFTIATVLSNGVSLGRIFQGSSILQLTPPTQYVTMTFDATNVYITNNDPSNSYDVNIKCHNLDITKQVDYTLPKPPILKTPYDPTFGIKVVKYGKSIGSTDLRDYILHSRAQSPAVLSVVTEKSAYITGTSPYFNYAITYVNPANYVPWTFAFMNTGTGQYYPLGAGPQASTPDFQITTTVQTYTGSGQTGNGAVVRYSDNPTFGLVNQKATIVVLRDPLIVPNTLQVNY